MINNHQICFYYNYCLTTSYYCVIYNITSVRSSLATCIAY